VLAKWRFRSESGDLAEAVVDVLRSQDMTLATAESCTAGLIAKRLTDHAGASDVFIGGVVAYHDSLKTDALGVSEEALERHGAVSEPVAIQMARGVVERCGADVGLAVTGVAGPGGGSVDKPVGRVWLAVSIGSEVTARSFDFMGDRTAIRERAAQAALALVLRAIEQRRPRA
jgi:PncC family amidohydrolase